MLTRLVEANFIENLASPTDQQVHFWLRELRTSRYLIDVAKQFPKLTHGVAESRPLLRLALAAEDAQLEEALLEEERAERDHDRQYWQPLLKELEQLRRQPKAGT